MLKGEALERQQGKGVASNSYIQAQLLSKRKGPRDWGWGRSPGEETWRLGSYPRRRSFFRGSRAGRACMRWEVQKRGPDIPKVPCCPRAGPRLPQPGRSIQSPDPGHIGSETAVGYHAMVLDTPANRFRVNPLPKPLDLCYPLLGVHNLEILFLNHSIVYSVIP